MTKEELCSIIELCNRTTPGPWISSVEGRNHFAGSDFIITGGEDIYLTGATVDDQDFIAAAKQIIPNLARYIAELKGWEVKGL